MRKTQAKNFTMETTSLIWTLQVHDLLTTRTSASGVGRGASRATAADAAPALARAGLADLPAIADPTGQVAGALGIERGSFVALLGPRNILRAIPAFLSGHGIGYPVGDPLRMPAVFVLERGRVVAHHHHRFAGERVDFRALAAARAPNAAPALAPDASPAHT